MVIFIFFLFCVDKIHVLCHKSTSAISFLLVLIQALHIFFFLMLDLNFLRPSFSNPKFWDWGFVIVRPSSSVSMGL